MGGQRGSLLGHVSEAVVWKIDNVKRCADDARPAFDLLGDDSCRSGGTSGGPRRASDRTTSATCELYLYNRGGSVAEWLACWTQAQMGQGSNRRRDAVLGKLFTPIVPLFTKQQNW